MNVNFNDEEVIIVFNGLEIRIQEKQAKELANRILDYFNEETTDDFDIDDDDLPF